MIFDDATLAQVRAMPEADRAAMVASVHAPLRRAMAEHAEGQLGERELLAVSSAVNAALLEIVGDEYRAFADEAESKIQERLAELGGVQ